MSDQAPPPDGQQTGQQAPPPAPPQTPPQAPPQTPPQAPPAAPHRAAGTDVGQQVLEALGAMPEKMLSAMKEGLPNLTQPPPPPAPVKTPRRSFGEWWFGTTKSDKS
jgi:hypothetical protein